MESPRRPPTLAIDARSEAAFLEGWAVMAGVSRFDRRGEPSPEGLVGTTVTA
jgi:hypothetical protein